MNSIKSFDVVLIIDEKPKMGIVVIVVSVLKGLGQNCSAGRKKSSQPSQERRKAKVAPGEMPFSSARHMKSY